ncbi:polymer-forming cytoskeletal protein [Polaribacter batillariae]|uniref:Polymer-forming cytoskeletal protein n=1 Tax=Polaribacter batillariae TaxID=2808900 RepID=A0ABX7SSU9_9FLAO|nr:polymer-forming cytoskeletal protein [Polaribacter batillariae]QTD36518.1 polymer-forming cytoskeletal protein [Polaribacter batillariae]
MFNSKEKKIEKPKVMERNVIAKNTTIVGDIKSDGDFRIDGTLEGTLKTQGRVIIGVDGFVKGNVEASNADIEGKFSGTLQVSKTLTIKGTANISGDVTIGKLSIEPGATFNATCAMKGALKEMNTNNGSKKTTEKTA